MASAGLMRSIELRREREASWLELEQLLAAADKRGLRGLDAHALARLPHLYRATLSSLSVARSTSLDRALVDYLENLVARAYVVVYGARAPIGRQLAEFFRWRWPDAVRRARWHVAIAAVILVAGAVAAYTLTRADSDYYYTFAGDMAQGRTPASSTAELRAGLYEQESVSSTLGAFASFLFSHNARIGILAFATGFVAGLPTVALLFLNGLIVGAFVALYAGRGLGVDVWAWLLPHGVTELTAIVMCGAGGLLLAHGLVFPGARPRLDSLRERGRDAAVVVIGAVVMLFVAGLIEGIFRQTVTDVAVRFAVAGATALGWGVYFGWVGRGRAAALEGA